METFTLLALPLGAAALGTWLLRSVFKDVSLKDTPPEGSKSAHRAEGLSFQLSVAEDLGLDPVSLNNLRSQVDLATEDAERDRQMEAERQTEPVAVPWLVPVAAVHNINRERKNASDN